MKEKNIDWMISQIEKIRKEKRVVSKSISPGSYNKAEAKKRKELKEDLKRDRRRVKRAEKQNWKRETKDY